MTGIRLCDRADVPANGIVRVEARPGVHQALAVADSDGELFCIDDRCTHQEASLADGWVEDGCVECPMHESRFDLRTGEPDVPPARVAVRTHAIEVVEGVVYLVGSAP